MCSSGGFLGQRLCGICFCVFPAPTFSAVGLIHSDPGGSHEHLKPKCRWRKWRDWLVSHLVGDDVLEMDVNAKSPKERKTQLELEF